MGRACSRLTFIQYSVTGYISSGKDSELCDIKSKQVCKSHFVDLIINISVHYLERIQSCRYHR
jgi:hypothetical protein